MTTTQTVGPGAVWDVINGYAAYWAVAAASDLGIFDRLAASPAAMPGEELAGAVGAAEVDPVVLLADTLVALGLLTTDGAGYGLLPVAAEYLVTGSPRSMASLVRLSPGPHAAWPALAATVRAGTAAVRIDDDPAAFYPALVRATAPTQRAVAAATAAELVDRGWLPVDASIVDLGAGSGAWVAALLEAQPASRAVAVDLPEVAGTTTEGVAAAGVAGRTTVLAGDYLSAPLPMAQADVVVLAHVLRAEPEHRARALLRRALALAGPAGTVVVADYPRPDPPTGPDDGRDAACAAARHELLLSLTMLASTAGAGVRVADLRQWSADCGAHIAAALTPLPRQHVYLIRSDRSSPMDGSSHVNDLEASRP